MKFLVLAGLLLPMSLFGQERGERLRFVFYNVENLFDPFDDSLTADEEFLPGGTRGWTWNRFEDKLNRIHKVLIAMGGWMPPDIIGLCEVSAQRAALVRAARGNAEIGIGIPGGIGCATVISAMDRTVLNFGPWP